MKVKLLKYPYAIVDVEKYKPDFATYIDPQIWQYPLGAGNTESCFYTHYAGLSGGLPVSTVHQKDFEIL